MADQICANLCVQSIVSTGQWNSKQSEAMLDFDHADGLVQYAHVGQKNHVSLLLSFAQICLRQLTHCEQ